MATRVVEAVREGRRRSSPQFRWTEPPPDPQDEETFARSRLDRALRERPAHRGVEALYHRLLALRREHPALRHPSRTAYEAMTLEEGRVLFVHAPSEAGDDAVVMAFNFDARPLEARLPVPPGTWEGLVDSSAETFGGPTGERLDPVSSGGTLAASRSRAMASRCWAASMPPVRVDAQALPTLDREKDTRLYVDVHGFAARHLARQGLLAYKSHRP